MKMINYKNKKKFFFYYLALILFICLTNQYFNYEQSLIYGGWDGRSYINISNSFPNITDFKTPIIHSERFFFYYIFGFISKLLSLDIYNVYRFFVFTILILINAFILLIFKSKNIDINSTLIFLTLINLNPYISRFYISIPTVLNDLIFILGLTIFVYSIESNKTKVLISSLIILFFSRQTSIAIILGLTLTKFIYGDKFNFNYKKILFVILIFFIVNFINHQYASHTSSFGGDWGSIEMRLFGFFIQDYSLVKKIFFLLLPGLSFIPLILYFITHRNFKNIFSVPLNNPIFFLYFIISLLIFFQPILSGVHVSGKNVIRLTTLSYVLILFLLLDTTIIKKIRNKFFTFFLYIFIILWSLHPTFSNVKVFKNLSISINKKLNY
jgi:hypothetical protein